MTWREISNAPLPEDLARAWRARPGFFFLDSSRRDGERDDRAFSFLGFAPFLIWRAWRDRVTVEHAAGTIEEAREEPLGHLRALLQRHRVTGGAGPVPFAGGAVGFFGYEFGACWENVRPPRGDEGSLPAAQFGFFDGLVAYDHTTNKCFAVAHPGDGAPADAILDRLARAVATAGKPGESAPVARGPEPTAEISREDYLRRVARVQEYIAAGDIYQVNLSQRFEAASEDDPFGVYTRLRQRSPAPFGAYLELGGWQILSSSPELFLRLDGSGRAVTRPIKGTRPRGASAAEDARLAAELMASEKDHAELLMIVDLERNDLGRVCRFGSVRVDERHRLEAHPTVFHLVATVSGEPRAECDVFDCLRAMFPGGSITGAPKVRAMQIIAELETGPRHVYTGSIGYLGFDGRCDLNVAIRTIVCRDGRASYHVGSGIVADSRPEAEYQETLDKARALRAALVGSE